MVFDPSTLDPEATNLHLFDEDLTDSMLEQIVRRCSTLLRLLITGARFTEAGLKVLTIRPGLRQLALRRAGITNGGLQHIGLLTGLRSLYLSENGSGITDEGLAHLRELRVLKTIDLGGCTALTDAGLEQLKSLAGLKRLYVDGTQVTDAGVRDFVASVPDCEIHR